MIRKVIVDGPDRAQFENLTETVPVYSQDGELLGHVTPIHLVPREVLDSLGIGPQSAPDRDEDSLPPHIVEGPRDGTI
jgi:hypothetical protein